MDFGRTQRGFAFSSFTDRYGETCSLQKSSLAFEDAVWLGIDSVEGRPARMHLTQEMVAALLPALQAFVLTGSLPGPTLEGTPVENVPLRGLVFVEDDGTVRMPRSRDL